MEKRVKGFLRYLEIEKNTSHNTNVKYRSDLTNLTFYLKNALKIESFNIVTPAHLRDYIEHIKVRNCLSSVSVSNKISVIKSFFKFLYVNDYISKNPSSLLSLPKKHKKIPKFLNEIELAKLLSAPDRARSKRTTKFKIRDKLILTIFTYTGIRKSELLNLNWDDINLGVKYLTVRKSKNKTDRTIPLHNKVVELLDSYLTQRLPITNNALVVSERGKRLNKNSLNNLFFKYIHLSGLEGKGYTIHSLRHTFASRLLNENVSLYKIKSLLGHRSIESTEIYLHITGKDLIESINSLI